MSVIEEATLDSDARQRERGLRDEKLLRTRDALHPDVFANAVACK